MKKFEDFTISLNVSLFRKPFTEQFEQQGLNVTDLARFEDYADAITRLHVNGYITDVAMDRARVKLVSNLVAEVEKQCPEKITSSGKPKKVSRERKGKPE